jgi:hypothetical protein
VKDTRAEASTLRKSLGDTMGDTMVVEGYDPTPRIGGFKICPNPIVSQ